MFNIIDNRLAVLMAERLEKITVIAKKTGISRTTLTSIYYKKCKCITFDVLGRLCKYFNCQIQDILIYKEEA